MWPPARTTDHEKWLEAMLDSLGRAGLEHGDFIGVEETARGISVKVTLRAPVPKADWPLLRNYISSYSIRAGWLVEDLRQRGCALTFAASRA